MSQTEGQWFEVEGPVSHQPGQVTGGPTTHTWRGSSAPWPSRAVPRERLLLAPWVGQRLGKWCDHGRSTAPATPLPLKATRASPSQPKFQWLSGCTKATAAWHAGSTVGRAARLSRPRAWHAHVPPHGGDASAHLAFSYFSRPGHNGVNLSPDVCSHPALETSQPQPAVQVLPAIHAMIMPCPNPSNPLKLGLTGNPPFWILGIWGDHVMSEPIKSTQVGNHWESTFLNFGNQGSGVLILNGIAWGQGPKSRW